jgi:VWFA-related protein
LFTFVSLGSALAAAAQAVASTAQSTPSLTLSVAVDEVGLSFHAADAGGLPVNDLRLDELRLLDNGMPPSRILALYPPQNQPIRAGILIDTSDSMRESLHGVRDLAARLAQHVLRQAADHAFVMEFAYSARILQPWTGEVPSLEAGVQSAVAGHENSLAGSAIFNTLYRACSSEFGAVDPAATGNFILLFSDGEDNAGQTTLENVVTACQHTNTVIYAFAPERANGLASTGPRHLADLALQTGGRLFSASASGAEIDGDLRTIEADLRNQYRLVYKPAGWKHDGSFHRIELRAPGRVDSITFPSGYYAPVR